MAELYFLKPSLFFCFSLFTLLLFYFFTFKSPFKSSDSERRPIGQRTQSDWTAFAI